jgi:competence protein CoiA
MKYALICGKKTKATKGAIGFCQYCGSELIAKCGEVKINHWAHKGTRHCDPWWENETEWHRSWKGHFPDEWQEVVHKADDGEKHVADVKTEQGWTIEFQHSLIRPEERRSRDAFYPNLVWVVDGMKRVNDIKQFERALKESQVLDQSGLCRRVNSPDECRLLTEWADSTSLVLFDFQNVKETADTALWILLPGIPNSKAYLMSISQNNFLEYHLDERFDEIVKNTILPYRDNVASIVKQKEKLNQKINRKRSSIAHQKMVKKKPRRHRRF